MERYINVYVLKLVMLTVESLVIAINKTRYQFAILVKRYFLNFFYNRRFITGIFKKEFGERLYKTLLYLIFGYIRSPYYKGFPDFNLII